jgi:hypothetical protein
MNITDSVPPGRELGAADILIPAEDKRAVRKHPLMARARLCLSRHKTERCSFSATSEGGCYEVSKGVEVQI